MNFRFIIFPLSVFNVLSVPLTCVSILSWNFHSVCFYCWTLMYWCPVRCPAKPTWTISSRSAFWSCDELFHSLYRLFFHCVSFVCENQRLRYSLLVFLFVRVVRLFQSSLSTLEFFRSSFFPVIFSLRGLDGKYGRWDEILRDIVNGKLKIVQNRKTSVSETEDEDDDDDQEMPVETGNRSYETSEWDGRYDPIRTNPDEDVIQIQTDGEIPQGENIENKTRRSNRKTNKSNRYGCIPYTGNFWG